MIELGTIGRASRWVWVIAFTAEAILWAVRWYLMFPVSYRDLELMLLDRGVEVDHTTIFRWIQAYATELEKPIRPHLRMSNGSWRMDETYIRVKGRWTYLYRAADSRGQTIDFLLSARRDTAAAKRSAVSHPDGPARSDCSRTSTTAASSGRAASHRLSAHTPRGERRHSRPE
jgi:transposase-like protein